MLHVSPWPEPCLQYRLADLHSLTLLERKGYLTISVVHAKDGKILLRSWQGIQEWYDSLQGAMADTGWPGTSTTDQWLLSRRNIAGTISLYRQ